MGSKGRPFVSLLLLIIGSLGIFGAIDNPRFQLVHGSDIVKLVGSGMCFGVALGIVFARRMVPGEGSRPD